MSHDSFRSLFGAATGVEEPYGYQARIAEDGLPEVLSVPTGTGKTVAAVLPWLWRRRFHPDPSVRAATPHWLVICLPMRVLTEQTARNVRSWLGNLGLDGQVLVHVVMGGEANGDKELRDHPERDAVLVGTLDMLLSRALNRGYGASRQSWPIDFGLLHNGCHWVFDEVQLMGPALETSRQLDGFRQSFGTVLPASSTWMSATVSYERLKTIDKGDDPVAVGLSDDDKAGPLRARLTATKTVRRLDLDPKDEGRRVDGVATELLAAHRPGTLTLAVHNTIKSARATCHALGKLKPPAEVYLLHSRFRPDDRARIEAATVESAPDAAGAGRIVVTTQVLEAGVDVSAAVLYTEAAPWPSIVQRAGRCNRDGLVVEGAQLLWSPPLKEAPYEPDDIADTVAALVGMEGTTQTSTSLGDAEVATKPVFHPVLRRVDLLGLFDTTPDLSGNDIDIAPYIRPVDGMDVSVAWRDIGSAGPGEDDPAPRPRELCGAPLHEVKDLLKKQAGVVAWVVDHLRRDEKRDKKQRNKRWRQVGADELRPGMVLVLAADAGCYTPTGGWDRASRVRVAPVADALDPEVNLVESADEADEDRLSLLGRWYPLTAHLDDVEGKVRELADQLFHNASGPLADAALPLVHAAEVAGRLHDIGKVHPVFQATMARTQADTDPAPPAASGIWAKGGSKNARHNRRGFCHELASALALMAEGSVVLDGEEEKDLIRYLVAAHHGRVRMGIRALADERLPETAFDGAPIARGARIARGIVDGELLPSVELPGGPPVPSSVLRLDTMGLGRGRDGEASWTERALVLRDRDDIGPFRMAWLEALVRLADWQASAAARSEP